MHIDTSLHSSEQVFPRMWEHEVLQGNGGGESKGTDKKGKGGGGDQAGAKMATERERHRDKTIAAVSIQKQVFPSRGTQRLGSARQI